MNLEARLALPADAGSLANYAGLRTGGYDELMDASGAVRPHWSKFLASLAELPAAEQAHRAERLNRRVREMGIAHDIFADPTAPGKTLGGRPRPAHLLQQRVALPGSGPGAARATVQCRSRRRLRRAAADARRRRAAGPRPRRSRLLERLPEHSAYRRSSSVLCRRPRARCDRRLAGRRQPHRDARRRRLRARQPRRAHPHRRRHLPEVQRGAPGAVLPAGPVEPDAAQRAARPAHRAADAGPASRGLFQPRLSRALSRLSAGGGRRPAHGRRPHVPQDARRPEAHRSDRALRRRARLRSLWSSTPATTMDRRGWCRPAARRPSSCATRSASAIVAEPRARRIPWPAVPSRCWARS